MPELITRSLAPGVDGCFLSNARFKTFRASVNFVLPLGGETVSANAFLPFLLGRACRRYPDFTALNLRLNELYGAALTAEAAKMGDAQIIRLSVVGLEDRFAPGDEKILAACGELLRDLVFDPPLAGGRFEERALLSERRLFLDRLNAEINDKRRYAISRCEGVMCENEPYGIPKYGGRADAEKLDSAAMVEAWRRALERSRVRIGVVGQTKPDALFDLFAQGFARETRCVPELPQVADVVPRDVREVTEHMAVQQGKLAMGFRSGAALPHGDVVAAAVMADLFGGGPYSKLFKNVREKLSLCYYCAARYNRRKGLLLVDSGVEEQNAAPAKEEILRQLAALGAGDFGDEELAASKLALADAARTVSDTMVGLDSWYTDRMFDEYPLSPEEYAAAVEGVTRERVVEAAKRVALDTVYLLCPSEARPLKGNAGEESV